MSAGRIVINHATVRETADMVAFARLCAERGLDTVSIWGSEIDKVGEKAARAALEETGLKVSGYNRVGPFEPQFLDRARFELERAARFGADHVLVFTGGLASGDRDLAACRRRHEDVIGSLLDLARDVGITLALEPLHPMLVGDRTTLASLSHANALCDALGEGVGIVIDVHHVWWDERLGAEIARAGQARRIVGYHVNDWLVPTRHLLRDRGMMGDGVIDLAGVTRMVRDAGFAGPIEVEIFSDDWARRSAAEVIDLSIARCAAIFGGALAA
ncbi:sugar phosphate isomerase/epimerase family protein [Pelagibacterium lacus]|uniref:Sugar phosphate isomerase/epimerase n=1 Tax=Pelagibacterium lacus TaxID=2282655 RepID=A0A369W7W1_9HYPH|nr:sugar phosphate isomerase/epimerase family protein [Pelagibacterium lacus]RDE10059.1 sugar phosphate isomerase/epimerase [Pelagibacterium lacus]